MYPNNKSLITDYLLSFEFYHHCSERLTLGYNPFMQQKWDFTVLGRLFLVLITIILLNIAPEQHEVTQKFKRVNEALRTGSLAEAARLTAEAARQMPRRKDLWERAGNYAWQGKDYPSAVIYFEQAVLSQNLSTEGWLHLAEAYLYSDKPAKAVAVLHEMKESELSSQVYIQLFQAHRMQKDYPAALSDMLALCDLAPQNANHFYVSGLLQMVTQPDRALDSLQKASSLDENFTPTVTAIMDTLLLVQRSGDPVELLMAYGRILAALQEWELAGEAFHQAAIIEPDLPAAWAFLGEARQHGNGPASIYASLYPMDITPVDSLNDEDGLTELQKALLLDPQFVTGHVFLALYWQRHQRFDQALTSIDNAIRLSPEDAALYSQKGSIQAMLGDLSGALASYQQAVDVSKNKSQILKLLITFCITYEYQLEEAALPAARLLLQKDLKDPASLDLAGQILTLQKDPAAKKYLERALDQDVNYAPAHLHLGLLYLQQGDLAHAKEKFTLAKSLSPDTTTGIQAQRLLETYFP